jgi:Domain of unknown function (DUF4360)
MKATHESGILSALLTYTALTAGCAASGPISDYDQANVDTASVPLALSLAAAPVSADVSASGSGCAGGSWTADVSDDGTSVSLALYEHEASTGTGSSSDSSNCAFTIRLNSSQGVSYAVSSFSYDGNAGLDVDVRGSQSARYSFQGAAGGGDGRTDLVGPYADDFSFYDDLSPSELVWSPCGTSRILNVNSNIVVSNGSGDMSVDNLDLRLSQRGC